MNILNRLKYRFSETHRIRAGYGLSAVRNDREYQAVLDFCREQLKDKEDMKLNPERKRVYEMTLMLDKEIKKAKPKVIKFKPVQKMDMYFDPYDFIEDHAGWYWD